MNDLYMMGIITDHGIRGKMIPFLNQSNIHAVLATLGTGTGAEHARRFLGISLAEEKELI